MAAPRGNQFWKLRSKHGRDRLFADADELWTAACEYFQWVDKHPWKKVDFKGKNNQRFDIPAARPYTLTGLCLYLDCNITYFNHFESSLNSENDKDFFKVITRIRETIYTQKFEGAAVGAFNANIIARDLGLVDKKDVTTGGDKIKTDEELIAEIERLKKVVDGDG